MAHTVETHMRIYNDDCGSYLEIRPDTDSLDLIEINQVAENNKRVSGLTIAKEEAVLLHSALGNYLMRTGAIKP